ncbi:NAD(P)-dependent oxidoreductase [Actinoallomurus sp. CA-150999]|uniref:NAD(P)-dependent oxidoreductase n=1 Tax=Actinoallomurus sp. CA-150999 TaxID=3239887 RepID=UPI003D8B0EA3
MSRLIVFGAAGRTGEVIVREALHAGHTVTAAVRDPGRFSPELPVEAARRVSVARADVLDPDEARAALAGHDAVVSAIGPAGRSAHGLYSGAARSLVAAMTATGVRRLLTISSAGVRDDDPGFPLWYRAVAHTLLKELYGDMRRMETIIRESPLDWTFVRPTRLTDTPATEEYRVGEGVTPPRGRMIARTDLARFVVRELEERRWSRKAPTLAQ